MKTGISKRLRWEEENLQYHRGDISLFMSAVWMFGSDTGTGQPVASDVDRNRRKVVLPQQTTRLTLYYWSVEEASGCAGFQSVIMRGSMIFVVPESKWYVEDYGFQQASVTEKPHISAF